MGCRPMQKCLRQHDACHQRHLGIEAEGSAATAADLHKSKRPAAALRDVLLKPLRRETEGERLVKIDSTVANLIEPQRDEVILGDGNQSGSRRSRLEERSAEVMRFRSRRPRPKHLLTA